MMVAPTRPLNVFYASAEEDIHGRERLERHLSTLQKQGLIIGWHEGDISAGTEREEAIKQHLEAANLILLLLSPDFLTSPFYCGLLLAEILERPHREGPQIIPILLRPVDLTGTRLSKLQPLPKKGISISLWSDQDQAWLEVVRDIRAVIEERRSATSGPRASSHGPSRARPIWHVPYRRNPFFTGRDHLLTHLHERLTATDTVALTQPQAISGLGGIGKTQTALEYAYRYRTEYRAVLWTSAASRETLLSELVEVAGLLNLPMPQDQDQALVVAAVKRWLAEHEEWLLILDNADELNIVSDLLLEGAGHILLTTRAQSPGVLAHRVEVQTMDQQEGIALLLRRAGILESGASVTLAPEEQRTQAAAIVRAMDGLPLALDQAGAYIEETGCSLSDYLKLYQQHAAKLLGRRGTWSPPYPHTVATTWALSFAQVEQKSPTAADLLRLCAFLDPDAIPEELLTEGATELGPALGPTAADPFKLNEALNVLRSYSLIRRTPETRTLTIHRLVQAVLIHGLAPRSRKLWARRTVLAMNEAFPKIDATTWAQCHRYLPHALACARFIEDFQLFSPEAAALLNRIGWYLRDHARYAEAEPLLQQSITIYEHTLGSDHVDLGSPLNNLGLLYQAQGRYAEAEPLYHRYLAVSEQELGPEHPHTATTLNNLGLLYQAQGRYQEAEPLCQRALAIYEQHLGAAHPETAATLNNLAALYQAQGRYEEAEPLCQRALGIKEQVLGPGHPETGITLFNLAALYQDQGRYDQAEPLYQRALAVREKVFGSDHPEVAVDLEGYAGLLRELDRAEEADILERRAREIRAKHDL